MAVGSTITATRFNQLRASVNSVLGTGSGNFGYGQQLASSSAVAKETVTADQLNKLRTDIRSIYVHQRGDISRFSSQIFNAAVDVSVANNSFLIQNHELVSGQKVRYVAGSTGNNDNPPVPGLINNQTYLVEIIDQNEFRLINVANLSVVNITGVSTGIQSFFTNIKKELFELIDNSDYVAYSNLANILSASRNEYTTAAISNNFTSELNKIVSTRSTPWGGEGQSQSIFHEIRVSFSSANARRHFFNAGGQIRFEATLNNFPGGDGLQKFNNWRGMFTGMGVISFGALNTTNTGSGTASLIGNFDLTPLYEQIFRRDGSGIYSDNNYIIKAKSVDTRTIDFLIEFNDLDQGTGIMGMYGVDEPVEGILRSRVHQLRATGNPVVNDITKVISETPTYQNIRTL